MGGGGRSLAWARMDSNSGARRSAATLALIRSRQNTFNCGETHRSMTHPESLAITPTKAQVVIETV